MEKFNNQTLKDAVEEWSDNEKLAESKYGHISNWDTSEVTDMSSLFSNKDNFNEPIGNWDVSNVKNMNLMFFKASMFNQDIGSWDVSGVQTMHGMFAHTKCFNQNIGSWNVSNVKNMCQMFSNANSFNQDISNWNVKNVEFMFQMFSYTDSFNCPIGNWNISSVFCIDGIFHDAKVFNQDLKKWKFNACYDNDPPRGMFIGAESFDSDNCPSHCMEIEDVRIEDKINDVIYEFHIKYPALNLMNGYGSSEIWTDFITWCCVNQYQYSPIYEYARKKDSNKIDFEISELMENAMNFCEDEFESFWGNLDGELGFGIPNLDEMEIDFDHRVTHYLDDFYELIPHYHISESCLIIENKIDISKFKEISKIKLS